MRKRIEPRHTRLHSLSVLKERTLFEGKTSMEYDGQSPHHRCHKLLRQFVKNSITTAVQFTQTSKIY